METTSILHITRAQVPEYLQTSAFLEAWYDTGELVEISATVLKLDTSISCLSDLRHILQTLRYWIVGDLPSSVFHYVLGGQDEQCEALLQEFSNDLPVVACLLSLTKVPDNERWVAALQLGNRNCVKCMYELDLVDRSVECCSIAASAGAVECLKYFRTQGFPWPQHICCAASKNGHIECLKYLHDEGCNWSDEVCSAAAQNGHLGCLKFLHDSGCPWSTDTCSYASLNGHIECLKFLHEQGCPWDARSCDCSASNGHEVCLLYAMEEGCVCTTQAACLAAAGGHLHILHILVPWVEEPWTETIVKEAASNGHIECLEYLYSAGCALDYVAPKYAAWFGQLHCLKYLHEHEHLWAASTTTMADVDGNMDCLVYAVEHGCPVAYEAYQAAFSDEIKTYIAQQLKLERT